MSGSIIGHLILKDWRLNRLLISLALGAGAFALLLTQAAGDTPRLFGAVWFFVALCVLGSMLPGTAIVNERKRQTLPFIMSLPVSSVQYSVAKVVSVWGMFLVPWLTLLISAIILAKAHHGDGAIPMMVIVATLPLIGFCLISATALVGESEGWLIAASVVCNSSYWFGWYSVARIPSLTAGWKGPVAIWSPAALVALSLEFGSIIFILALTFFLQSRKRDFV